MKPKVNKKYFYGRESKEFTCISSGEETSIFIDENKTEYQFYNEDMHDTPYTSSK